MSVNLFQNQMNNGMLNQNMYQGNFNPHFGMNNNLNNNPQVNNMFNPQMNNFNNGMNGINNMNMIPHSIPINNQPNYMGNQNIMNQYNGMNMNPGMGQMKNNPLFFPNLKMQNQNQVYNYCPPYNNNANFQNNHMNIYQNNNFVGNINNIDTNQIQNNIYNTRPKGKEPVGVIPSSINPNLMVNDEIFPPYAHIINIIFLATSGLKYNVYTPDDITLEELFKKYVKKIGLHENVLDKIIFIADAVQLSVNDQTLIRDFFPQEQFQYTILVVDKSNILGA